MNNLTMYRELKDSINKVEEINARLDGVTQEIKEEVNLNVKDIKEQIDNKRDADIKITNQDLDISSDSAKIKLINLSEEVQAAMAGTTPVIATVADNSITSTKYADNSIKRAKIGTSIGSSQDVFYSASPVFIKKDGTDIRLKFYGSDKRVFYKNVEKRDVINLTDTEYLIPTNSSLVYTLGDYTNLYVKVTDQLTIEDHIILTNHNGIPKATNIKIFNIDNLNNVVATTCKVNYKSGGTSVTITIDETDRRIFLKNGKQNINTTLAETYTIPSSQALVWDTYVNSILVKSWDNLSESDVVLIGNHNGKIMTNNISAINIDGYKNSYQSSNIVVYYAGHIFLERNYGTTLSINFAGTDKRLFVKDTINKVTCNLSTTKFTLDSNQSLVWNRTTNVLEIISTDNLSENLFILVSNHRGFLKHCKLRIENIFENMGYPENCREDYTVYPNLPVSQGVTFIDNYLLSFGSANDDHSTQATLSIINLETMNVVKTLKHNIGHINSCDYDEKSDTMIIGNNTGSGQEIAPAIYIFYNAKQVFLNSSSDIDFDSADKTIVNLYDGDNYLGNYGDLSRPNVCIGEHPNIMYLIMNDNSKCYRLFLGKGTNNLNETKTDSTWGEFTSTTSDRFNGTCKIINTYFNSNNFGVNQGVEFYNGKLYLSTSHGKCMTNVYDLLSNGVMKLIDTINIPLFDDMGNILEREPEGICIKDGYLYQTYRGDSTAIVKTKL